MANGHFALQVLQKAVREMIQSALTAGILLVSRAAVRTDEFHLVLLRIAVQSSPSGAAHANGFRVMPVHGVSLLRSTSSTNQMHKGVMWIQVSVSQSIY